MSLDRLLTHKKWVRLATFHYANGSGQLISFYPAHGWVRYRPGGPMREYDRLGEALADDSGTGGRPITELVLG